MSLRRKEIDIDDVWPSLLEPLRSILDDCNTSMTMDYYMEKYTKTTDYCMYAKSSSSSRQASTGAHCGGGELYARIKETIHKHLKTKFEGTRKLVGDQLLKFYKDEYNDFCFSAKRVHMLFTYLNRYWIKSERANKNRDVYELMPMSLVVWREEMFDKLRERLTAAVLNQIERARNAEDIDSSLLKSVIDSYVRMGLTKEKPDETNLSRYKQDFEGEFLKTSELYYTAESSSFVEENSVADYMKKVEARLAEEKRRVEAYLHPSTEAELMKQLDMVLIQKNMDVMHAEFSSLLAQEKVEDLLRMYSLLSRIEPGLPPMRSAFEAHVVKEGSAAIAKVAKAAVKDAKVYVEELLSVWRKFNDFVTGPFNKEAGFAAALDKACRRIINNNEVIKLMNNNPEKSPELIAYYCDGLLRKGQKDVTLQNLEPLLADVITIFQYVDAKDVFMKYYSYFLAKRLIDGKSESDDAERVMIEKLKDACGFQYIGKLQRMFNDMNISRDLKTAFDESQFAKDIPAGITFEVLVLCQAAWPMPQATSSFTPPPPIIECESAFKKFYLTKQASQELNYLHRYSKHVIKSSGFYSKPYQISCSSYQLGVLYQFNKSRIMTYGDLQAGCGLDDSNMKHTIRTLVKSKLLKPDKPIYSKSDEGKVEWNDVIPDGVRFIPNKAFKSNSIKVEIHSITIRDTSSNQQQHPQLDEAVEQERKIRAQAAIVRLMKARKELEHNELVTGAVDQLQSRFIPTIKLIKTQIDWLIEQEYMERIPDKRGWYRYLA
eukprot:TRINITY_DN67_c0_g1_i1.p1 TRINITY_DN67_c0_g1~~TRINITY_DN67_c0_g1_i1.p1  ORF type:complete len:772 (+),score=411.37 TRINITY_DN67_c0_g1_i1:117-2432(+)